MRWRGWGPRSSEIDAFRRSWRPSPPLPRWPFLASERRLNWNLFLGRGCANPGADRDYHPPRLYHRPVTDWPRRAGWLLAAAVDLGGLCPERDRCRQAAVAA